MFVLLRLLGKGFSTLIKERLVRILILVIGVIAYGTIGFHLIEGQPWTVSFYWTFVTIGTVGYGDFSPESAPGMYFTTTLIIFGIGTFAIAIESIIEFLVRK